MLTTVCTRCGKTGHTASSCTLPVPPIVPPALGRAEERAVAALAALERELDRPRRIAAMAPQHFAPPPAPLVPEHVKDLLTGVVLGAGLGVLLALGFGG